MNEKLDPIVLLAKLLSLFVTATTAEMIAPQLGIFIAGAVGGVFGVMSWRKSTRLEAVRYVILAACAAWFFATVAAWAIVSVWPKLSESANLYQLCALGVGAVGHRWPAVIGWAVGLAKTKIEALSGKAGS